MLQNSTSFVKTEQQELLKKRTVTSERETTQPGDPHEDEEERRLRPQSKRQKRSRSKSKQEDYVSLQSGPVKSLKEPKSKSKKKKKAVSHFFEDEADEGDEEEEDVVVKQEGDTYSEEFLKQKAPRLDNKMIKQLLDKYEQEENMESMQKEQKSELSKFENVVQEIKEQ